MKIRKIFMVLLVSVFICVVTNSNAQKNIFKASTDKDGVQRVSITGGEYFFNPDYVILKVNIPVELSVRKESGVVPHEIVMKAPEAGMDFSEKLSTEPTAIKFTPVKTGRYPYYCSKKFLFFKSHRDRGMEGIIEVID